jgi:heme-degrading monooxygenase HmoA
MGETFHHVVLFRLKDGVDPERARKIVDSGRPTSGLVSWQVERSIDERKGAVIAEVAVFESAETFQAWRESPLHQAVASQLSEIADWWVADWM